MTGIAAGLAAAAVVAAAAVEVVAAVVVRVIAGAERRPRRLFTSTSPLGARCRCQKGVVLAAGATPPAAPCPFRRRALLGLCMPPLPATPLPRFSPLKSPPPPAELHPLTSARPVLARVVVAVAQGRLPMGAPLQ